ncbi:MAG: MotA/TolQ/ExbB proton channel family protein [bacterium]
MWELIGEGGPVTWIIMASGLVAAGVFLERVLHLHRARIKSEDFLRGIVNNLRRGNVAEAVAICDETPGPVASVVRTAIQYRSAERETLRTAVENVGRAEISRMERRLVVLASVAQVAPVFGLLGTVLGMIRAVLAIRQQAPLVESSAITDGLLAALVATAAGLAVAAPCYVAFNFLVGRVEKIVLDMESASSEIIGYLNGSRSVEAPVGEESGDET